MRRFVLVAAAALAFAPSAAAWTWPAEGDVLRPFVFDPAHPYAAGQHRGIDIGGDLGATVIAPAGGTVSFAGTVPTNGKTVTIQTADGYSVTLVGLGTIAVKRGASVAEGDVAGTIGPSSEAEVTAPHVHLGVRITSEPQGYVDPQALLPPRQSAVPPAPPPDPPPSPPAPPVDPPAAPPAPPVDPPAPPVDPPAPPVDPPAPPVEPPAPPVDPPAPPVDPPAPPVDPPAPPVDPPAPPVDPPAPPVDPPAPPVDPPAPPVDPPAPPVDPPAPPVDPPAPPVDPPAPPVDPPAPPVDPPAPPGDPAALGRDGDIYLGEPAELPADQPSSDPAPPVDEGEPADEPGVPPPVGQPSGGPEGTSARPPEATVGGRSIRAGATLAASGGPAAAANASISFAADTTTDASGEARPRSRVAERPGTTHVRRPRRNSERQALARTIGERVIRTRATSREAPSDATPWLVLAAALTILLAGGGLAGARLRTGTTPDGPSSTAAWSALGADEEPRIMFALPRCPGPEAYLAERFQRTDSRRGCMALRGRPAAHRPCSRLRRSFGRLRPLSPPAWERRLDGLRHRRARHSRDGRRRPRRAVVS
jgi:hypothetical protein